MGQKKTKTDSAIMAALIGAMTTVLVAIISVFGPGLLETKPTPVPQTMPAITTPSQSPLESTPTPTPTITVSITPTVINTSNPTTSNPTPTKMLDISDGCINSHIWTLFEGAARSVDSRGCWQLLDWGISPQDGGLLIFAQDSDSDQEHQIYTAISGDVDIRFNIKIDELFTPSSQSAHLGFGIANKADLPSGKFLYFWEFSSREVAYIKVGDSMGEASTISNYRYGTTEQVTISVRGIVLEISIGDELVVPPVNIAFSDRAFWIDYRFHKDSNISAFISEFAIEEK